MFVGSKFFTSNAGPMETNAFPIAAASNPFTSAPTARRLVEAKKEALCIT